MYAGPQITQNNINSNNMIKSYKESNKKKIKVHIYSPGAVSHFFPQMVMLQRLVLLPLTFFCGY